MRYRLFALFAALCVAALASPVRSLAQAPADPFVAAPYVQLGNAPVQGRRDSLAVLWLAHDVDARWSVEYRTAGGSWRQAVAPHYRRVTASNVIRHRVYRTVLTGLEPGVELEYRVLHNGNVVFTSKARVRKPATASTRVVVFGDCGDGSASEKRIAFQAYAQKPDYVVIPGDIVYGAGLISQYLTRYFPVYNAKEASPEIGAPLIRSIPFIGLPGNHDVNGRDLGATPDGLAYYLYFDEPLNGPPLSPGDPSATPIEGDDEARQAFLEAAGPAYPRMANFSFDYGNVHWTVLDADTYVDWSDPDLRAWLVADLERAKGATWRFVTFHQPGFSSSKSHFSEQHMRHLSPIFERYGVDVVWCGHVHNYQRSKPLRFKPAKGAPARGVVAGEFTFDDAYDGDRVTRANGVLYIVTGGGGASLYNPEQEDAPNTWQPFTVRFLSKVHSLTVADIDGKRLTVRQIDEFGKERDRWVLTK